MSLIPRAPIIVHLAAEHVHDPLTVADGMVVMILRPAQFVHILAHYLHSPFWRADRMRARMIWLTVMPSWSA
jgi:hypothetical protein